MLEFIKKPHFTLQFSQILRYLGWVFIAVLLTHAGASKAELAEFEYFIFISSFFTFFWISGLTQSFMAFSKKDNFQNTESGFMGWILFFSIASSFIATLYVVLTKKVSLSFPLYLLVLPLSSVLDYILFKRNESKKLLFISSFSFTILLTSGFLLYRLYSNIHYVIYATVVISFLKFIYCLTLCRLPTFQTFFLKEGKLILKNSAPLLASFFLAGLAEFSDGFIINYFLGSDAFVTYRYGARELPLMLLISSTFSMAMIKETGANLSSGLGEIKTKSLQLMHIFFPLSVLLIMLSTPLYKFFFNNTFTESALIFNIYLLLAIPRLLFPQTIVNSLQKTNIILYSSIVEIILNISLSIVFLQYYGIAGVAFGSVLAFLADKLILSFYLHKYMKISIKEYTPTRWYLFYSFLLITIFVLHILYFY